MAFPTQRERELILKIAKGQADILYARFELARIQVRRLERKMNHKKKNVLRQVQKVPTNRSS